MVIGPCYRYWPQNCEQFLFAVFLELSIMPLVTRKCPASVITFICIEQPFQHYAANTMHGIAYMNFKRFKIKMARIALVS